MLSYFAFLSTHHPGENATYPIEPPWRSLSVLLLLAGTSQPRRRALTEHASTVRHGFCRASLRPGLLGNVQCPEAVVRIEKITNQNELVGLGCNL